MVWNKNDGQKAVKFIEHYRPETGFDTPERCHIVELLNTEHDPECSIACATVKPGTTTQLHKLLGVTERYVIIEGEGNVEIGGDEPVSVSKLDTVIIKPEISQKITNTGKGNLVFLCICTPRFNENCYVPLE